MVLLHTRQWPSQTNVLARSREGIFYSVFKRLMDVMLSSLLLILCLPMLLVIALLIKLDSPGPAIFKHERVGAKRRRLWGDVVWVMRNFTMYKFRTMIQKADSSAHESYIRAFVNGTTPSSDSSSARFKLTNDPRVTRIGRILRRTSLDELPQLVNVLKGDMSLVGPRPVPPYEVACYRNGDHQRLAALPGITGLWQVKGRCQVPFEKMIEMDLEYIRKASLWLDLKILLWTIPAVLSQRGAE